MMWRVRFWDATGASSLGMTLATTLAHPFWGDVRCSGALPGTAAWLGFRARLPWALKTPGRMSPAPLQWVYDQARGRVRPFSRPIYGLRNAVGTAGIFNPSGSQQVLCQLQGFGYGWRALGGAGPGATWRRKGRPRYVGGGIRLVFVSRPITRAEDFHHCGRW